MNKEILMVVDAVSNEKGVDKEIIFEALEAALASATRRRHGEGIDVRVSINRKTGDYDTWRRWKVFADDSTELEFPERELRLEDAREIDPQAEPGGYVEVPMESVAFGRIAAQTAKQVIVQKVREAERAQVVGEYKDRVNTLVSGIVKRVDRNGVFVDLGGNAEGFIPRDELIPREPVRSQDRIKAFLRDVLGLPFVDAHDGWLIFGLPPSEVAVHPHDANDHHEFYFICEDAAALVAALRAKQVECTDPVDRGWGVLTQVTLPGGGRLGMYEPRHARPENSTA